MGQTQNIEDWAKKIGGRFARVLELRTSPSGLFARVRTDFSIFGIDYLVPADVHIPDRYRKFIDQGEIDLRRLDKAS